MHRKALVGEGSEQRKPENVALLTHTEDNEKNFVNQTIGDRELDRKNSCDANQKSSGG